MHLHSSPGYSVNMLFNQVLQEQSNKFFLPNLPSAPLLWSLFPFVLFPSSIFLASKSMYPSNLNLWLFWAAFRFFLAESLEEEAAGDSLEAAAAALAAVPFSGLPACRVLGGGGGCGGFEFRAIGHLSFLPGRVLGGGGCGGFLGGCGGCLGCLSFLPGRVLGGGGCGGFLGGCGGCLVCRSFLRRLPACRVLGGGGGCGV